MFNNHSLFLVKIVQEYLKLLKKMKYNFVHNKNYAKNMKLTFEFGSEEGYVYIKINHPIFTITKLLSYFDTCACDHSGNDCSEFEITEKHISCGHITITTSYIEIKELSGTYANFNIPSTVLVELRKFLTEKIIGTISFDLVDPIVEKLKKSNAKTLELYNDTLEFIKQSSELSTN